MKKFIRFIRALTGREKMEVEIELDERHIWLVVIVGVILIVGLIRVLL